MARGGHRAPHDGAECMSLSHSKGFVQRGGGEIGKEGLQIERSRWFLQRDALGTSWFFDIHHQHMPLSIVGQHNGDVVVVCTMVLEPYAVHREVLSIYV